MAWPSEVRYGFLTEKRTFSIFLIITIAIFLCPLPVLSATRIMPLGDSITKGWYGSVYRWGYRKPLYDKLTNDLYDFDFIGSSVDGVFSDPNHEGHNGWRADELLNGRIGEPGAGKLQIWLNIYSPDVILLHIGTNDITQGHPNTVNEVNDIFNLIDSYEYANNKHITVFLALIINRRIDSDAAKRAQTTQLNSSIYTLAMNRITTGDDIIIVDMETALDYSIGADMSDEVHPNDNGYLKMANIWYDALSDYFKSLPVAISGYVFETDTNTPLKGVLIEADSNTLATETDANGFYQLLASPGWTSSVIAQKEGYIFDPNSIIYTDVNQDYTDMNYTAMLMTFTISGFVLRQDNVTPIEGVDISADNGAGSVLTDTNGFYQIVVDYNWTGNITAAKDSYGFSPNSIHYQFVNQNYSDQNFTGSQYDFNITGFIKNQCGLPVKDVFVNADNNGLHAITDINGFYKVWVNSLWSGTVSPVKQDYTFNPDSITYIDISADQTDQNFIAYNTYDLDCDLYVGWGDIAVFAQNWLGSDIVDLDNNGIVDFIDFAQLALVW